MIDDDEGDRRAFARLIGHRGHTISSFSNAYEFLEKLEVLRCDILISDHNMDGMKGLQLLKYLRKKPGFELLPVVILTGSDIRLEVESAGGVYAEKGSMASFLNALELVETKARFR